MAIFMFSSAGVPPLAGFVGKFYLFGAAVRTGSATGEFAFTGLAIVGVLASIAGAYYYLRVLVCMYFRREDTELGTRGDGGEQRREVLHRRRCLVDGAAGRRARPCAGDST